MRTRSIGNREYRKNIYVVTEGKVTEKDYLKLLQGLPSARTAFAVRNLKRQGNSIKDLIKSAKADIQKGDQIWIAVDRDSQSHTLEQMQDLAKWEEGKEYRHVALSCPRFEFWLLLHFEERPSLNAALSDSYMDKYIPSYSKGKGLVRMADKFTEDNIRQAIERARAAGLPSCDKPDDMDTATSFGELAATLSGL